MTDTTLDQPTWLDEDASAGADAIHPGDTVAR
jgi:hypothetical protein